MPRLPKKTVERIDDLINHLDADIFLLQNAKEYAESFEKCILAIDRDFDFVMYFLNALKGDAILGIQRDTNAEKKE